VWFEQLTADSVFFVTRLKSNADYIVVEDQSLPQRQGLLRDQIICLTQHTRKYQPPLLRRIEFHNAEQNRILAFLTNNMKLAAATVAEIYKNRWQFELFFKTLKQSCRSRPSSAPWPTR
jgi:IS4 transposase